jgi:hypothetical protein
MCNFTLRPLDCTIARRMPAYKKQHYLPAAYLKYFADDQAVCTRKSSTWRYDGKEQRRVPVESQCFKDYFYSKKNAAEAEKGFHSREMRYCKFVDELRAGKEPSRNSHGDLLLNMIDLQLRNGVHKNLTDDEGLEAYNVRLALFLAVGFWVNLKANLHLFSREL